MKDRVALIQCPAWLPYSPPFGLAAIASFLVAKGYDVKCFDINALLYNQVLAGKTNDISPYYWDFRKIDYFWREKDNVISLIARNQSFLDNAFQDIAEFNPDILGFSVQATSEHYSQLLSTMLRDKFPSALILWGGANCFPHYDGINALHKYPFVDAVFTSLVSNGLHVFIQDWLSNNIKDQYPGFAYRKSNQIYDFSDTISLDNINELPFTDFSLLDTSLYGSMATLPMITARGCINRCAFCNESSYWGKYSPRDPEIIVNEIQYQLNKYPNVNHIWFTDLLINGNLKYLEKLCDLIIEKRLQFGWDAQFVIRKNIQPVILKKMKQAGCQGLHVGLESGSSHVLKLMRKGYNAKQAKQVLGMLYDAGLRFYINLIAGFPGESKLNVIQTALTVIELQIRYKIPPPPAAPCAINKGSLLETSPHLFNIAPASAEGDWYTTKGPRNHQKIRFKRKAFLENVFNTIASKSHFRFLKAAYLIISYFIIPEAKGHDRSGHQQGANK